MFTKNDITSELKCIPTNKDFPKRFEAVHKTYYQNNCYIIDVTLVRQDKNASYYLFRVLPPKYEVLLYQLPPTEVGGLFLSSVVKRLKADSLPKDSVL